MDRIIILGAGVMQGPAIRIAGEMGLERFVLDGNADAVHRGMGEHFYPIDLKDTQRIYDLAARLKAETSGRLGIMTAGTDFSAPVAYAAERLGLPGHRYEAALNAGDKARMRDCLRKAGVPSPSWTVVDEAALQDTVLPWDKAARVAAHTAARDRGALRGDSPAEGGSGAACGGSEGGGQTVFAKQTVFAHPPHKKADEAFEWRFPLVVKPCDNMGGRGCSRVDGADTLLAAVADAVRFSRTRRAIVEEYMDGPEFSVDAIAHNGALHECGFADRHIFFPPYFIEMGHTMPSNVDAAAKRDLMRCFEAGVKALGLTEGAAKGDLKLTSKGPMIGEIAARLSGGYMSGWTFPYASGFEVTKAAIEIAMGIEPVFPARFTGLTSAERAVISIPGTVRSVTEADEAAKMPGVKNVFLRVAPGDKVTFPRNNVEKCGNVISAAENRRDAAAMAERAANAILIRLEPGNEETEAFLFGEHTAVFAGEGDEAMFPPLAFQRWGDGELRDYTGRTLEETGSIVEAMTGRSLPSSSRFEDALMRGGYQGGVYFMDTHGRK
jgi:biotin carboxylase